MFLINHTACILKSIEFILPHLGIVDRVVLCLTLFLVVDVALLDVGGGVVSLASGMMGGGALLLVFVLVRRLVVHGALLVVVHVALGIVVRVVHRVVRF